MWLWLLQAIILDQPLIVSTQSPYPDLFFFWHSVIRYLQVYPLPPKYLPHQAKHTFYHSLTLPHNTRHELLQCTIGRRQPNREHPQATKTCSQSYNRLSLQNVERPIVRTASLDVWAFSKQYKLYHPVIHVQMPVRTTSSDTIGQELYTISPGTNWA